MRHFAIVCSAAAALSGFSPSAGAETPWTAKPVELQAGVFLGDFDTEVALTGPNSDSAVALEDDLGLDSDQTTFRAELRWRFADRHRLNLGYYEFDRDASGVAARSFTVETDDQQLEFDAGAAVDSEFDWRLIPLTYTWSFLQNDRVEMAASIGAHWATADLRFEGTAVVNGDELRTASEQESTSAPLPVLGLEAVIAVTPRWRLGARAQYFGLDYNDYSGNLTDLRLLTEFRFSDFIGIGVGYTWYEIDFSVEEGDYDVDLSYDYSGPEAFVTIAF